LGTGGLIEFYAISVSLGVVSYAFLLFSVPRVALDGVTPMAAIPESLGACVRNILPLLAFVVGLVVVIVLFWIVFVLLALLVGGVAAVLGKFGAVIGGLLAVVFALALLAALIFFMSAAYYPNYLMWRDVFGCSPDAPANDQVMV